MNKRQEQSKAPAPVADEREFFLIMGYGETDFPEFKTATTKEEAFEAVCGMMFDPASEMPKQDRQAWYSSFFDPDEWSLNGTRWDVAFEIGGIEVTKVCIDALSAPAQQVEAAQSAVPDDVWEALQRLIENAAVLGPSSEEDARLVIRWRGQFVPAREAIAAAQSEAAQAPGKQAEPIWWHHVDENGRDVFMNMPFGLPDATALCAAPQPSHQQDQAQAVAGELNEFQRCQHPECGRFQDRAGWSCRAMRDNACARKDQTGDAGRDGV